MRSAEVVHFEAGFGGMKGNIVRAMLPFISGHRADGPGSCAYTTKFVTSFQLILLPPVIGRPPLTCRSTASPTKIRTVSGGTGTSTHHGSARTTCACARR